MQARLKRGWICFLILVAFMATAGCKDENSTDSGNGSAADTMQVKPVSPHVVAVRVEAVTPGPLHDILILPGETEAAGDVLLAAERGGVVEWVGVTEGQRVTPGQEVARINLTALRATRDRARANLRLTEEQFRRRQTLHASEVLAREELERADTERIVASTELREAEVAFDKGSVVSTLAGVINKVYVDPGEFVAEGGGVVDIVNTDTLRIICNVPEADVRFLAPGQQVTVRVDTYGERTWEGAVDFVAWKADPTTRTFAARVIVDNREGLIRPGMIARVAFVRRSLPDALTVPLFALQDKGGERVVFVEQNGTALARTVEVGIIGADRVQIVTGLMPNDRIIVAGQTEVEDGTRVDVR